MAVHGPSKAEITCVDNGDGTCTVEYVPDEPGKHKQFYVLFWYRAPCSMLQGEYKLELKSDDFGVSKSREFGEKYLGKEDNRKQIQQVLDA